MVNQQNKIFEKKSSQIDFKLLISFLTKQQKNKRFLHLFYPKLAYFKMYYVVIELIYCWTNINTTTFLFLYLNQYNKITNGKFPLKQTLNSNNKHIFLITLQMPFFL